MLYIGEGIIDLNLNPCYVFTGLQLQRRLDSDVGSSEAWLTLIWRPELLESVRSVYFATKSFHLEEHRS